MSGIRFVVATILVLAMLSGCATVPMGRLEADTQAKAFQVAPDRANLYIYRSERVFGSAIKMTVLLDGQFAGDTGPQTYILKTVTPGPHTLVSKTENDATLTVDAKAGKNYFIWQEVKMGWWAAKSSLQLVEEATGKAGVNECKLVQ